MSDDRYGDISDEQRIDVELEGELSAEISIRFEGKDLEDLLWAVRELGIGPAEEFARRAVLSEIKQQRAQLEAPWLPFANSEAVVPSLLPETPLAEASTQTIGPSMQVNDASAAR